MEYEPERFPYIVRSHYLPDWRIAPNIFVETKGYFSPKNRSNLLAFREQYPEVTILLMFQKSDNKINKTSKTTYASWAEKHEFMWADIREGIPKAWVALAHKKKKNTASLEAIKNKKAT